MTIILNRYGQPWNKTAPGTYETQLRDGSIWRWSAAHGLDEVTDIWTTEGVRAELRPEYGRLTFRQAQSVVNEMDT